VRGIDVQCNRDRKCLVERDASLSSLPLSDRRLMDHESEFRESRGELLLGPPFPRALNPHLLDKNLAWS
jgi:hypothetical protein